MNIRYIKYDKYIVTIEDLSILRYYDSMKYSSATNNFKVISIEDIFGIEIHNHSLYFYANKKNKN